MTIVNDDSRVVNKLEASLTDDTRVVIYYHHMFIVQATGMRKTLSSVESVFSMIKPSGIYALRVANDLIMLTVIMLNVVMQRVVEPQYSSVACIINILQL